MVLYVFKFLTKMRKRKIEKYICKYVYLFTHNFWTSRQLDLPKKNNGGKKLYGVNIRAIHRYTQVGADYLIEIVLLFEYAWAYALKILPKQFSSIERAC